MGMGREHQYIRTGQRKRNWQRRPSRSMPRETNKQQNTVSQMPQEEIVSRRKWPTVSKQDSRFYEKEVVGERAHYSFYPPFSPLLCAPEGWALQTLSLGLLCPRASKWAWPMGGNGRSEGRRGRGIFPHFPSCFGVWSWEVGASSILFSLVLVLTILVPSLCR